MPWCLDFLNSSCRALPSPLAMGGSQYDDDWVLPSADITLVLVGKLGYGKSATGNSILGREAFVSDYSHASVTNTCQMGSTTLKDGRTINVIDTPGNGRFSMSDLFNLLGHWPFRWYFLVPHVILTSLSLWFYCYNYPLYLNIIIFMMFGIWPMASVFQIPFKLGGKAICYHHA